MTKPIFNISASQVDPDASEKALLLMEVNESSFSYVIVDDQQNLLAAAYYVLSHVEGRNLAEAIKDIIDAHEILHNPFREAVVVYNFPESTLVPDGVYHHEANRDVMDLLFGNLRKGLVLSEKNPQIDVHTIYRVPAAVHSFMQQKFAAGKYWHIYTLWISSLQSASIPEGQHMFLIFGADKVLAAVYGDQQLLLLQSFAYTTPEDVVYHLLHCCDQLGLSQDECALHISGFIDEDSALFNEIKKYFLKPEFDTVQSKVVEGAETEDTSLEYPPHYFSYLQKLALCV
jgi:hypothetical protein